jgi:hypothetical protein
MKARILPTIIEIRETVSNNCVDDTMILILRLSISVIIAGTSIRPIPLIVLDTISGLSLDHHIQLKIFLSVFIKN